MTALRLEGRETSNQADFDVQPKVPMARAESVGRQESEVGRGRASVLTQVVAGRSSFRGSAR